ncbi:type II toxin-antitoxin system RelE/ParE family toxin [Pedobacter heparinus]|uniref:type II toxin-antitoxin system RelE/ParE family toxin n=1 Tax=Pedobacter heparinus TaxID=984 RepID=UPI00292ED080|nr:type II toxin-antitoxin system RelE/ParE family toxin [Pedobacter heparinus]
MSYKIIFHPDIQDQLIDAGNWYEDHSEGLGDRFIATIERHIKRISNHPEHYQIRKRNYRESKVDSFPYVIVFEFLPKESCIIISDIFHTSRKPGKKYRK